jgi:phosphorylated CTD-interacting factor 1
MAKKVKGSKKKKSVEPITSFCNVSGLANISDPFASAPSNELDDCLALMDQSIQSASSPAAASPSPSTKESKLNGQRQHDKNETAQQPSPIIPTNNEESSPTMRLQRSPLWKGPSPTSSQQASKSSTFDLPNIQVELLRHKLMGDLSKFFLSKCKHLRMPSLERWIIDSKMEERIKRQLLKAQASQEAHESGATVNSNSSKVKDDRWKMRQKRKRRHLQSSLEKHLTSSGLRPHTDFDAVIPSMADVEDDASERLLKEIERGTDDIDALGAKDIVKELCKQACDASRHLQNLANHLGTLVSDQYFGKANGVARISLEVNNPDESESDSQSGGDLSYSLVYSRKTKNDGGKKAKPFVVKINVHHYEKLRDMFHAIHDTTACTQPLHVSPAMTLGKNPNRYSPAANIFHHLIFCLLLRYASLSGAQQLLDLRGGGMQGAIHSEVFDCIEKQDGGQDITECFASPLNVYTSRYFSIFHNDLDWHFGSCGDFFSVPMGFFRKGGVHEANPPFSPGLMLQMVEKMEEHLSFADSMSSKGHSCALSFIVVVPSCSSKGADQNIIQKFAGASYRSMLKSRFFSKHIILNAREHGYVEGSQHLRPTRFKESQYNTSIVILQSADAKDREVESKCFMGLDFEQNAREAFASRHQIELEKRRENNAGGVTDNDKVDTGLVPLEFNKEKRKIDDTPRKRGKKSKKKR